MNEWKGRKEERKKAGEAKAGRDKARKKGMGWMDDQLWMDKLMDGWM